MNDPKTDLSLASLEEQFAKQIIHQMVSVPLVHTEDTDYTRQTSVTVIKLKIAKVPLLVCCALSLTLNSSAVSCLHVNVNLIPLLCLWSFFIPDNSAYLVKLLH